MDAASDLITRGCFGMFNNNSGLQTLKVYINSNYQTQNRGVVNLSDQGTI